MLRRCGDEVPSPRTTASSLLCERKRKYLIEVTAILGVHYRKPKLKIPSTGAFIRGLPWLLERLRAALSRWVDGQRDSLETHELLATTQRKEPRTEAPEVRTSAVHPKPLLWTDRQLSSLNARGRGPREVVPGGRGFPTARGRMWLAAQQVLRTRTGAFTSC